MNQIIVELQEFMGSDASIANAAWTSTYDKNKREDKYDDPVKVANIVPKLIQDGHGVPLESVIIRFWIRLPIFVDRQHMTHRIASHNGLSGRYRTMPVDYFQLPQDVLQILNIADVNNCEEAILADLYTQSCELAVKNYLKTIQALKDSEKQGLITNNQFKRAREVIRAQLPTAGMVERTTIFNLRSFANYQFQRNSLHAQAEIKSVAEQMLTEVKKANICPIAIETLEKNNWKI